MNYYLFFVLACCCCCCCSTEVNSLSSSQQRPLQNWKGSIILKPTERKASRTAVLIIAPRAYGTSPCFIHSRWKLGETVWKQYMNTVPNVDCYFVKPFYPDKEGSNRVWIEGNTIYVEDFWSKENGADRILHKTIAAIELLLPNNYTHFVRTNLNTFFNLNALKDYTESHHKSMYTGLWESGWYTVGYGILFTADVAAHMASEYRRLEHRSEVSPYRADDAVLTSLATGVYPYDNSELIFNCCPSLPYAKQQLMSVDYRPLEKHRVLPYWVYLLKVNSLEKAMGYCNQASDSVMLYRIREGLTISDQAILYDYLLHKTYPNLPFFDLVSLGRIDYNVND